MDNSPLSKLPPELRSRIYVYALQNPRNIIIAAGARRMSVQSVLDEDLAPALPRTCRALLHETQKLLYAMNTFVVRDPFPRETTIDFVLASFKVFCNAIGEGNSRALGTVIFDFGALNIAYFDLGRSPLCKLVHLMSRTAAAKAAWQYHCSLHGKVTLSFSFAEQRKTMDLTLDFEDIESSWAVNVDAMKRKLSTGDTVEYAKALVMLELSWKELRTAMAK